MTRTCLPILALAAALSLAACGDDASPEGSSQAEADAGQDADPVNAGDTDDVGVDAGPDTSADTLSPDVDTGEDAAPDAPAVVVEGALEPGPFTPGFQRHELTYRPANMDEDRTLRVAIWYPTEATEGEPAEYADLLPREGVFNDAPVALGAPAPVMIFSHGSQAVAQQSWYMTEFFASHGSIIVAPDHPGNTLFDMGEPITPYVELRPQDVRTTIDYIDALEAPASLAGLFGDQRIMVGHSFGAYTTLAVAGATYDVEDLDEVCGDFERGCEILEEARGVLQEGFYDPRIQAAVPMTPGGFVLFGAEGVADIDLPVLLMTSGRDNTVTEAEEGDPIWAALDGPDDRRVVIEEGGHLTYSNLCEVVPSLGADEGCADDFYPPERAHLIINTYVMAFARYHLLGDDSMLDLLNGERTLDEGVTVHTP